MLFSRAAKARLLLGARVIQPAIRMEIANLHAEKKLPYSDTRHTPQEELQIMARRRSRTLGAGRWLRWTTIFFHCTERAASVLRLVAAMSACNAMRRGAARAVIQRSGAPRQHAFAHAAQMSHCAPTALASMHAAHMGCDTRGASSWTGCTLPSQLGPHGELQASR